MSLEWDNGFYYNVVDLLENWGYIDSIFCHVGFPFQDRPFYAGFLVFFLAEAVFEFFGSFVDLEICQVLESVWKLWFIRIVLLRTKPNQPIVINIDPQWINPSNHNIKPKIVFKVIYQMWFSHILLDNSVLFLELFLLWENEYATASRWGAGFINEKLLFFGSVFVLDELFLIGLGWEEKCSWKKIIFFRMLLLFLIDILVELILITRLSTAGEVVYFLKRVQIF